MKNHLLRLFVSVIGLYGATAVPFGGQFVGGAQAGVL
jgi:hypothetical protein